MGGGEVVPLNFTKSYGLEGTTTGLNFFQSCTLMASPFISLTKSKPGCKLKSSRTEQNRTEQEGVRVGGGGEV